MSLINSSLPNHFELLATDGNALAFDTRPSPLIQALSAPSRRVQFAAGQLGLLGFETALRTGFSVNVDFRQRPLPAD